MDPQVAVIGGFSVTMGLIVSVLVQIMKNSPSFPLWKGDVFKIRLLVAALCLVADVVGLKLANQVVNVTILLPAFMSYLSASATYDHFFQGGDPAPVLPAPAA